MTGARDLRARNQRVALILLGTFALLCVGSIVYIDWFHAMGPGSVTRTK